MTLISFLNAFDFILSFPQVFIQNMLLFLESLFFKERELVLVSLKREKKNNMSSNAGIIKMCLSNISK